MAVREAEYSKSFVKTMREERIILDEEDCRIRDEINSRFGFHYDSERGIGEGFDGKIWYSYKIEDNLRSSQESSQNGGYQTTVQVRKTGAENEICFWSDLEKLLVKEGFKELK
jgi:hypothetical protein